MLLWVILAALTAAVVSFLLYPLVRGQQAADEGNAFDAAVYRDQLDEIETDRARGLIGEAEAEAARREVARRLLAADEQGRETSSDRARGALPRVAFVVVAVGLPLAVLAAYLSYGSPRLPDQPLAARLTDPANEKDIGVLVARVEARLRAQPYEGAGWDAIAPIYLGSQRYVDAADAYRQAIRLLGPSAKRLAGLGQALVMEQQGLVTEPAREALTEALKYDETLVEPGDALSLEHGRRPTLGDLIERAPKGWKTPKQGGVVDGGADLARRHAEGLVSRGIGRLDDSVSIDDDDGSPKRLDDLDLHPLEALLGE